MNKKTPKCVWNRYKKELLSCEYLKERLRKVRILIKENNNLEEKRYFHLIREEENLQKTLIDYQERWEKRKEKYSDF